MSTATPNPLLRFASFEINIKAGELRRYGHRIKLQDKPFQILVALLERPGALVSREELHECLWSDNTFVDFDDNLNNAIEKLRKALNDSAEQPEFIETLPRRGYSVRSNVSFKTYTECGPAVASSRFAAFCSPAHRFAQKADNRLSCSRCSFVGITFCSVSFRRANKVPDQFGIWQEPGAHVLGDSKGWRAGSRG